MRLPVTRHPSAEGVRIARSLALVLVCLCASRMASQPQAPTSADRLNTHATEQWRVIEEHLPDAATATPQELEQEGDILRARRYPEDAMDFYNYALSRGGNQAALLNKLGLSELEMRNIDLARACFKRAVKLNARDDKAWNNLGAVEYLDHGLLSALADYKRAIKLDKRQAVYHANLATAYFETGDYGGARHEMAAALKLDPDIFDKVPGTGGVEAHVLTSDDRARFAYEMARLYARVGQLDQMLHSLAQACEFGMDVRHEMHRDAVLARFENDPRVPVMVHNAQIIRAGRTAVVSTTGNGGTTAAPTPFAE